MENTEFKVLATSFDKNQFHFEQLKRENNVAIYKKSKENMSSFEVIIIQKHNGIKYPNGSEVGPAEFYPSSASWGSWGFTYSDFNNALGKFFTLLNSRVEHATELTMEEIAVEALTEQETVEDEGVIHAKRDRINVEFPKNQEFTVGDIAKTFGVSGPLVHSKIKKNPNIKLLRRESFGKGQKSGIYILEE